MDISFPQGLSINDGIDTSLCSLLTSVDHVAKIVSTLGRVSLLVKINIEPAYWLIPVHP